MCLGSWHPPSAPLSENAPAESAHLPPESAYFLAVNRNKRSITVNLKKPEGVKIIRELVERSDVLVENFVSGKLASLGLGWEDCKKYNERLIYASITGMIKLWDGCWLETKAFCGRIWANGTLPRGSRVRCCY